MRIYCSLSLVIKVVLVTLIIGLIIGLSVIGRPTNAGLSRPCGDAEPNRPVCDWQACALELGEEVSTWRST